jgi:hypothetical protein
MKQFTIPKSNQHIGDIIKWYSHLFEKIEDKGSMLLFTYESVNELKVNEVLEELGLSTRTKYPEL